jgi:hypothetical protein
MVFNDTAILVLVVVCGVVLTPALVIAIGLTFGLATDVGRSMTHSVIRVRVSEKWRRYEHRKITDK